MGRNTLSVTVEVTGYQFSPRQFIKIRLTSPAITVRLGLAQSNAAQVLHPRRTAS